MAINLALAMVTSVSLADEPAKSADEIAKELSNPAGSLASLNFNLQYQTFKGDLPDADDQHSWSMIFQPTLPFPVGDQGRKFIFRPAVPVLFDQPVFDAGKGSFDDADLALGDITFDLVYAGNDMKTKKTGYLWGVGGAGTLPTATDADVAGKQWRLGPELFGGVIREWGLVGALVSNQWNIGGWDDASYSVMTAQYFYAYGLGKGWQITSSPVITYDWHADSDQALTLPLGIGVAKTTKIRRKSPGSSCPGAVLRRATGRIRARLAVEVYRHAGRAEQAGGSLQISTLGEAHKTDPVDSTLTVIDH